MSDHHTKASEAKSSEAPTAKDHTAHPKGNPEAFAKITKRWGFADQGLFPDGGRL